MGIIEIPPKLKEVLGDEATQDLIELFNKILKDERQELINIAEERFAQVVVGELSFLRKKLEDYEVKINSFLKEEMDTVKTHLSSSTDMIKGELSEYTQTIGKKFSELIETEKEDMDFLKNQTKGDLERLGKEISSFKERLESIFKEELTQKVDELSKKFTSSVEGAITTILEGTIREIKKENEGLKEGISYIKSELEAKLSALEDTIKREIDVKFDRIKGELQGEFETVIAKLDDKFLNLMDELDKKMEGYHNSINYNVDAVRDIFLKTLSEKFEYYHGESIRERKGIRSSILGWVFLFGIVELGVLGFIVYFLANK